MSAGSKIEWTDATVNFWWGCTEVSPACVHCYARQWAKFASNQLFGRVVKWGDGEPRAERLAAAHAEAVKLNAKAEKAGVRMRVFANSMSDWLDDQVPVEWLAAMLNTLAVTPWLDWQLLTKRPGNWAARIDAAFRHILHTQPLENSEWIADWLGYKFRGHFNPRIPANIWIGTTAEDQARADERIPQLLAIPAKVRFLSCEPLLSEVNIGPWVAEKTPIGLRMLQRHFKPDGEFDVSGTQPDYAFQIKKDHGLHWLIAGGESGPGARPMHPDWACGLRDQCAAAGVPFLFKQWGEWAPAATHAFGDFPRAVEHVFHDRVLDGLNFGTSMLRVGKHAAGRLLDGIEHNAFPA